MEKPAVLILGGCGFIGRNLVGHLISNDLVKFIRIVDKVPPQVAWLNSKHEEYFNSPLVEFKSANLINVGTLLAKPPKKFRCAAVCTACNKTFVKYSNLMRHVKQYHADSCQAAFTIPNETTSWDFVINCACETKPAQTDPVYKEGIFVLSLNCAQQAALHNVKHYVEISSGQMLNSEKVPHKENDAVLPWSFVARWKNKVENELEKIPNLHYTVLRPAIIYGLGDKAGLMPRIMVAAVYKQLGETMKLLWNADTKLSTVHVTDVCRAIWFVCNRNDTIGQIYNVVDLAASTQGSISDLLADLFNIKVDYYGNLLSAAADMPTATDEANEKHLRPWADACRKAGIQNTPLSPHMDSELLMHKHIYLDGKKLNELGFEILHPKPSIVNLEEIVLDYIDMKVFPKQLLKP